jgi:hypothetical protein
MCPVWCCLDGPIVYRRRMHLVESVRCCLRMEFCFHLLLTVYHQLIALQQLRATLTPTNVDDLLDEYFGNTALHDACTIGNVECVKYCLEMKANVNVRDSNGWTPLHLACGAASSVAVVILLLDAGALVDVAAADGCTPLYCAFCNKKNSHQIARLLLDRGARIVSNVQLKLPAIPNWVNSFISLRARHRSAATTIIGIHKYRRTNVTGNNDINVLKLIGKHIWSFRMEV